MKTKYRGKTKIFNAIRFIFANNFIDRILAKLSLNRMPNSFIARLLPSYYLYKPGSRRLVSRFNLNFNLDISELVDWHIYFGLYDKSYNRLFELCKSHYHILDAGANNGALLLRLSRLACDGFVYGFEPDPVNYNRCMINISLNECKNVQVLNMGLGSQCGNALLSIVDPRNLGMNRITTLLEDNRCKREIKITTIDKFVQDNNIKKLDLIKIDTEGYEMEILSGARQTLEKWKPQLFIEIDDNNLHRYNRSANELIKFMVGCGYEVKRADTDQSLNPTMDFSNCHFDIVASFIEKN